MTSNVFADLTLVTDDKQQIKAHQNILSACSPVFKNILLLESNNTNPVIYLRGIQHSEMESIMQFIYLGETRFCEERMSELSTGIEMNDQAAFNRESIRRENGSIQIDIKEHPTQNLNKDGEPQINAEAKLITVDNKFALLQGEAQLCLPYVCLQKKK